MRTGLQNLTVLARPKSDKPPFRKTAQEVEQNTLLRVEKSDTVTLGKRSANLVTDALAISQFSGSGYLYKSAASEAAKHQAKTPPFSDAPIVALADPFLIVPGWTTLPDKFDSLIGHLLKNPDNGSRALYLKEGAAYTDHDCTKATQIQAEDKIFVIVFDSPLSSPDTTAPQVGQAVDLVGQVHGKKIDVLGYSMGGLAVRKMLDEGDRQVDQVTFLGTAHQGTRFAALANYIIHRDIRFAMKIGGLSAAHLPAMEWMMPVTPNEPTSSPKLSALNARSRQQLENTNGMLSIGSDGLATITKPWGGTEGGDGLVQASSIFMDNVPTTVLHGRATKQHGALPADTDVFLTMKEYYNWAEVGSRDP